MDKHWQIIVTLACFLPALASAETHGHRLSKEEKQFAATLEKRDHLPAKATRAWLSKAHIRKPVIKHIKHPAEAEPWKRYQKIFITPHRVTEGVHYWQAHKRTLHKAKKTFGVPEALIVAIIGVESDYGKQHLPYRALDTLDTLAFYGEPRRQHFFQRELEDLFLLSHDLNITPDTIRSSYAGAIGYPQFMPSSYRYIAYPAKKHTMPDLIHNHDDAIMSVANYFSRAHWQIKNPVADPYSPGNPISANQKHITLEKENPNTEWLVYSNFHAIMSYNHSRLYAMTVALLAQRIKRAYHDTQHSHSRKHRHATKRRQNHRSQIRL